MLVTCPECGVEISESADPCPKCGKRSAGTLSWQEQERIKKRMEAEAQAAKETRRQLEEYKREKQAREQARKEKRRGIMWRILLFLLVALFVVWIVLAR